MKSCLGSRFEIFSTQLLRSTFFFVNPKELFLLSAQLSVPSHRPIKDNPKKNQFFQYFPDSI